MAHHLRIDEGTDGLVAANCACGRWAMGTTNSELARFLHRAHIDEHQRPPTGTAPLPVVPHPDRERSWWRRRLEGH